MGRLHLQCWCRHSLSPGDWPRRRAGLWVKMADQRERREVATAWRRMSGAALALVWASKRRKVAASWLHRPPISRAKTTSRHLLERRSSGYVRSLDRRASWGAAPVYCPARLRGWLDEVRGDTKVVSTASCAPPDNGSPLAIYNLNSSVIMPVNVFQVEITKPGVACNPGSCFPTDSSCCSFQRDPSPP